MYPPNPTNEKPAEERPVVPGGDDGCGDTSAVTGRRGVRARLKDRVKNLLGDGGGCEPAGTMASKKNRFNGVV
jgi:hypothetical protein